MKSTARLVIHAPSDCAERLGRVAALWSWLRSLVLPGEIAGDRASLNLRIDDLQGHRVHAITDAGPLIDVPLFAGTYQVTALLGDVQRGYTVALAPGASFDLYLRLAAQRR